MNDDQLERVGGLLRQRKQTRIAIRKDKDRIAFFRARIEKQRETLTEIDRTIEAIKGDNPSPNV